MANLAHFPRGAAIQQTAQLLSLLTEISPSDLREHCLTIVDRATRLFGRERHADKVAILEARGANVVECLRI